LRGVDLSKGVIDCGGGPASFIAELSARGTKAVSVDPLYAYSGAEIGTRFEAIEKPMISQVRATPEDWVWDYHRSPEALLRNRRNALEKFLADYETGRQERRYVLGELPTLPFGPAEYQLAVCSHLLFLYSDLLSSDFHARSVLELCRVAEEVRLFPLLTLAGKPSSHVATVRTAVASQGFSSEIVTVPYELQRGGNEMLRIFRV
jgi:hypothetical protein